MSKWEQYKKKQNTFWKKHFFESSLLKSAWNHLKCWTSRKARSITKFKLATQRSWNWQWPISRMLHLVPQNAAKSKIVIDTIHDTISRINKIEKNYCEAFINFRPNLNKKLDRSRSTSSCQTNKIKLGNMYWRKIFLQTLANNLFFITKKNQLKYNWLNVWSKFVFSDLLCFTLFS